LKTCFSKGMSFLNSLVNKVDKMKNLKLIRPFTLFVLIYSRKILLLTYIEQVIL